MAKDINQVTIRGRLCRDVEAKKGQSGTSYCYLTVATGGERKDDPKKKPADFHSCVAFAELADWLHGLAKGTEVEIQGRLQYKEKQIGGEKYPVKECQIIIEHVLDPNYEQREIQEEDDAEEPPF